MAAILVRVALPSLPKIELPLAPYPAACGVVPTGFPSPAADYEQEPVSLHDFFGIDSNTTWCMRAAGNSLSGIGLLDGDMFFVQLDAEPELGDVCIVEHEGVFVAKIVDRVNGQPALVSASEDYPPVFVEEVRVVGVVTGMGRRFRRPAPAALAAKARTRHVRPD